MTRGASPGGAALPRQPSMFLQFRGARPGRGIRRRRGIVAFRIMRSALHGARRSSARLGMCAPRLQFDACRLRRGATCAEGTPTLVTNLECAQTGISPWMRVAAAPGLRLRRSLRATRPWLASWMMRMAGCRSSAPAPTSWITRCSTTPGLCGMEGTSCRPLLRAGGGRGPADAPRRLVPTRNFHCVGALGCGGAPIVVARCGMGWHGHWAGGGREVAGGLAAGARPATAVRPPSRCIWAGGLEIASGDSFCRWEGAIQPAGCPALPTL